MKINKVILLFFVLILLEVGLRLSKKLKTYTEKNFSVYQSPYVPQSHNHIFSFNPNSETSSETVEYEYFYTINRYGFVFNEKRVKNLNNAFVVLGDSFTFGAGAPEDSSMISMLNSIIKRNKPNCEIAFLNAGMPGSDPFFQEKIMDSIFIPEGFKNFVYVFNISDLYDHIFRGGNERFIENGKLSFSKPPWYHGLYRFSYISRAIIHGVLKADYSLLPTKKLMLKKNIAVERYLLLFKDIKEKVNEINGELLVVTHPYPLNYDTTFTENWSVVNYTFVKDLTSLLKDEEIKVYDLELDFNKQLNPNNYLEYSWKVDGHFNSKGYNLFANLLYLNIENEINDWCKD